MLGLGLTPVTICGSLAASLPVSPSLSVHQLLPRSLAAEPFPSFDAQTSISLRIRISHRLPAQPHPIGTLRSFVLSLSGRINKLISRGQVRVEVFSSSFPVSFQLSLVRVAAGFVSFSYECSRYAMRSNDRPVWSNRCGGSAISRCTP